MRDRLLALCVLALVVGLATAASALTTLDFEGLPTTYYYFYGNQNIGGYYPGVTFGPDATIFDRVIGGYNDSDYPPHSGNAVFATYNELNYVDITFDTPVSYVEGWFTFYGTGYLEAYNADGSLVGSDSMPDNYPGGNDMMSVSASSIKWVRIHDDGGGWTGDDIAYEPVPEPSSLLALLSGIGGLGTLAGLRRRA